MSPPAPLPKPVAVAAPAATTTPVQAPRPPAVPPRKLLPTRFNYGYLTDDRVAAWQESGKTDVVAQATGLLSDPVATSLLFEELVRSAVDDRLPASEAGAAIKDILASEEASSQEGLAEFFLDSFSIVTNNPEARTATAVIPEVPNPRALRELLIATGISAETMRNELELYILMACGFLRNTFEKANIRYTTNLIYRQAAFNLLREESEGYSKLLTEFFTTTSSFTNTQEIPSDAIVNQTFERVKALIGAFDLDVGRVLDVTLDVFANSLVKHHKFFIKFFRASSWWPVANTWENVEWTKKPFSSLPSWAESGYDTSMFDEKDEKEKKLKLRQLRDEEFWQRVQKAGMAAWFELGGRRLLDPEDKAKFPHEQHPAPKNDKDQPELRMDIYDNNWIGTTGTIPPPSNRTAAQLLGFKLRFYASSTRDPTDHLHENLIYLAALLIKIGFISLRDLFPHLYPGADDVERVKAKLQKQKDERDRKARPGGGMNALLMAGALKDDDDLKPGYPQTSLQTSRLRDSTGNSTPKSNPVGEKDASSTIPEAVRDPKDDLPEPEDQKYALLRSLLLIGAIPEALFILGKYPWMMSLYPDLPRHVFRLLHHSLSKVWESVQRLKDRDTMRTPKPNAVADQGEAPKGHLTQIKPPARKQLRWPRFESFNDEGTDYIFYWDDWADNVPVCQSVNDVFLLCNTILNLTGLKIGQDAALLSKLAQIGARSLRDDPSDANADRWLTLCKRLIVPALSLVKNNPPVMNEVWELLQFWPVLTRYNIYAEWTLGQVSRLPDVAAAVSLATAETKDVLKRISKENAVTQARMLTRITSSNPGTVFSIILNQIESYDNMVDVVVTCCRNLTAMSYEVLTWSLVQTLGSVGRGRNRVQEDGMLTSGWLQSLSKFAGSVYQKYQRSMSSTSILLYVAEQVRTGNIGDLSILQSIISNMTGFTIDIVYSDRQIQMMAGGDILKHKVLRETQDVRNDRKIAQSARTLVRQLRDTMSGKVPTTAATQLLLAMAKEVTMFPNRNEMKNAPLKVLGTNLDRIFGIFSIYVDMLRWNVKIDDFDQLSPDLLSLITDHGVEPEIAWMICRQSISAAVEKTDAAFAEKTPKKVDAVKVEDVEMTNESDPAAVTTNEMEADSTVKKDEPSEGNIEMKDVPNTSDDAPVQGPTPPTSTTPSATAMEDGVHPALKRYVDGFKTLLPEDFEESLSVCFFVTFWQLGLSDIFIPVTLYTNEHNMLSKEQEDARKSLSMKPPAKAKVLEDTGNKQKALLEERAKLKAHSKDVANRIAAEKANWLPRTLALKPVVAASLLEQCFFPRLKLSTTDAFYCFQMLMTLHKECVPGFNMATLFDTLFDTNTLKNLIFSCTVREAGNFGRFLNLVLDLLKTWRGDKRAYEAEAIGPDKSGKTFTSFADKIIVATWTPTKGIEFDTFRLLLFKWHSQISNALKACLMSEEYMHVRNAIEVLKECNGTSSPAFPLVNFMSKQLIDALTTLSTQEKMKDLQLNALSALALLKSNERKWISTQVFKIGTDKEQTPTSAAANASTRSSTPKPGSSGLNASAREFKPSGVNGTSKSSSTRKADVEDGEIGEIDESKRDLTQATASAGSAKPSTAPSSKAGTPAPTSAPSQAPLPSQASHSTTRPEGGKQFLPSAAPQAIPARPDISRPSSTQPSGRAQHALPNRPEGRLPSGRPERTAERASEYGRPGQSGDLSRDDRRERSPGRRGRSRSPDRGTPNYRDRQDPAFARSRDSPADRRDERRDPHKPLPRDLNRLPREQQRSDSRGRTSEHDATSTTDRGNAINPDRAAMIGQGQRGPGLAPHHDRPPVRNDRSGYQRTDEMLSEREGNRRVDAPRSDRELRGQRSSRPQSPRHVDERLSSRSEMPREDRRDDRGGQYERLPPSHPSGRDTPTGPRDSHASRSRELFQPGPRSRPPSDPNHGRLSQDFAMPPRPSDPIHGQSNSSASGPVDAPSGPRGRNAATRGGRNFTAPAHGGPDTSGIPSSPLHDRAPSGPSFRERERREANMRASDSSGRSNPPTPSSENPPSGPAAEMSGIHPSRLNQIKPAPSTLQTNNLPSPSFPPSGPRSARAAPYSADASPATRSGSHAVPTGPSGSSSSNANDRDRDRRGDNDKRFTGLNSILQQSPSETRGSPFEREREHRDREREREHDRSRGDERDRGTSIRGRATRQTSFANDGPGSSPMSGHSGAPPPPPPPHGASTSRQEQYRDQDGSSRRRDGRRRSPGPDDRSTRGGESGSRAPPDGDRESRRRDDRERSDRDGREHGHGRDRESGPPRRSGRDDGGHGHSNHPLPPPGPPMSEQPPMRGGPRGGPREMEQHWGSGSGHGSEGRNGDVRSRRGPPPGGAREDQERRVSDRKRGRGPTDEGPSPDFKRPRRSQ